MNLKNYYWLFKEDPFEKNFVTDIKKEGLTLRKKHGLVGDPEGQGKKNLEQRKSKVSWINSPLLYGNINPTIHKANANAGWNFQWDWNESVQFTEYKKNDFYDWHTDSLPGPYPQDHKSKDYIGKIRKLSSIVLLSEPGKDFEGGELEMDFNNCGGQGKQTIDLKKGSCIVFPSFVKHRVKPVTKGTRHSLVLWHLGYPWC